MLKSNKISQCLKINMQQSERLVAFKKSVNNKFNIYNSLFLNLPYRNIENVGMIIPLMLDQCQKGLKSGLNPKEILESFFQNYVNIESEKDRIDLCFRSFNMLSDKWYCMIVLKMLLFQSCMSFQIHFRSKIIFNWLIRIKAGIKLLISSQILVPE